MVQEAAGDLIMFSMAVQASFWLGPSPSEQLIMRQTSSREQRRKQQQDARCCGLFKQKAKQQPPTPVPKDKSHRLSDVSLLSILPAFGTGMDANGQVWNSGYALARKSAQGVIHAAGSVAEGAYAGARGAVHVAEGAGKAGVRLSHAVTTTLGKKRISQLSLEGIQTVHTTSDRSEPMTLLSQKSST